MDSIGEYQRGSHTAYDIQYHIAWTTKYRYKVLAGKVALRLRELVRQGCKAMDITVIRGSIGKEHVHVLLSCPPKHSVSKIVQMLKGHSSKLMQEEFPELRKRYWGQHLWAAGYFCGSVGTITDEVIKEYIENQNDEDDDNFKITE